MSDIQITVYSKPGCQQCKMTTRHLDKHNTPYVYRDVTEDQTALDDVRLLGYQAMPVVAAGDMHWFGYRPDKLNDLIAIHASTRDVTSSDAEAIGFLTEVGFDE